jgi:hypothetical protein
LSDWPGEALEELPLAARECAERLLTAAEHDPVGAEFKAALAAFNAVYTEVADSGGRWDAAVMETIVEVVPEGNLSLANTAVEFRSVLSAAAIHQTVRAAVGKTFGLTVRQQEVAGRLLEDGTPALQAVAAAQHV